MVWVISLSAADLIAHGLTPRLWSCGIRSLIGFSGTSCQSARPVLYLRN